MSRTDGVVTSVVSDVVGTIPAVQTSAMALALYVQFQGLVDISDSLIAEQAFTAQTIDRLTAVNLALKWIPQGEFQPEDKTEAFHAYLDLVAGAVPNASLGEKDYAAFYSQFGALYVMPFPPQEININEQAEVMNLPLGQFSSVSIAGGPRELYFRDIPSLDDPGTIPAPVRLEPQLNSAPDGKPWVEMDGTTLPPGTLPGTYLKSLDEDGTPAYYRAAANGEANQIDVGGKFILFSSSFPAEQVDALRKGLIKLQNSLQEQSRTQADYMQLLIGQLLMMANAVSNSLYRIRRSAKVILDRGTGE